MPRGRQPPPDPLRKIRFREAARDIVAKDRYDRKYGMAVDTAGAIARALEKAYLQGFVDAQLPQQEAAPVGAASDPTGPLDWMMIPPRPRSAFWTICLFMLGKGAQEEREGYLEPNWTERGTPGWQLVVRASPPREKLFGEKTIVPLVRLGLLQLAKTPPERLLLSERGITTWRFFLQRGGQYPEDLTSI